MNKIKFGLTSLFVAIEIALFVLIVFSKLNIGEAVPYLCYASVVLAFCHSFLYIFKKEYNYLIVLGLLFTIISDLLLVLLGNNREIAMVVFSFAQMSYGLYLYFINKNKRDGIISLTSRLILFGIIMVIAIIITKQMNFLVAVSLFYFVNLIVNIVFAFINLKKNLLFAIGLLLFACCDVFTGLCVGEEIGVLNISGFTSAVYGTGINFIWLFYIPSQTLISISVGYIISFKNQNN